MGFRSTRVLAIEPFVNNKLITIPLQPDTCVIGLRIRLVGPVQYTYASGTPLGRPEGVLDSLITRIDVNTNGRNGAETHKSVRPHFLAMQQLLANGIESERFASAGASALANNFPTTAQAFVFGTTGQITTVRESVYLPFEQVFCEPGYGREMTWLNLKNYNTADIKIQCAHINNLLQEGNTAPVNFTSHDLKIEVSTIEDQSVEKGRMFDVWRQTMLNRSYKGSARDIAVELPKSDTLSGITLYTTNGDTNKSPTNDVLDNIGVRRNGMTTFQKAPFKTYQVNNREENRAVAAYAAGTSRLDGVAMINFLNERKINTALPVRREYGVDAMDLMLDLSSLGTYSPNEANVAMMFDEIIFAPREK